MTYVHHVRPRYGEIDMQGVVFNAHYLAFVDDACDCWFREVFGRYEDLGFDFMVKRADITWNGAARLGEDLAIACTVTRWGNTSFEAGFTGSVGERPVFVAALTYVSVKPGTAETTPVPGYIRERLSTGS